MAVTHFFWKQPSETYTIGVDYTDRLDTGRSLSSATWAATDLYDESDVSATVLTSTTGVVASGDIIQGTVQAGTSGHEYKLTCTATLDNSDILETDVYMWVQN